MNRLGRALVVTGSGISAESGIPTFRGPGGYWRNFDPTKLATQAAFDRDPALVWQWYRERRDRIRASEPNAAHVAIVKLARHTRDFLLLTQNVDDLHARAEWEGERLLPRELVQIHGDIFATRCSRCDFRRRNPAEDLDEVPRCPKCAGALRPGVIWFDEELDRAEVSRVENFLAGGACDAVLVVGTTAVFDYIVGWSARGKGDAGQLIEVNLEATPISQFATECLRRPAAQTVPAVVDTLVAKFVESSE